MQKILFIDRDGTLIDEPKLDYQVDSFEKLSFLPSVFKYLGKITTELNYKLVIITNQDGLGTPSFPESTFWPVHNKMLDIFKKEGIDFDEILIDKTFPEDNAPTRKPHTGLLTHFLNKPHQYDIAHSFVIGDRYTDIQLAKNIHAKGIYINEDEAIIKHRLSKHLAIQVEYENAWEKIYLYLKKLDRKSKITRCTKETNIEVGVNLDGQGISDIDTGLPFFNHMLEQIARHAHIDLFIKVNGDLEIDEHHTIEDTAITLGEAIRTALSKKTGMYRYGFCLPMDDALAHVALDFGGRPWIIWKATYKREKIGDMPTEMFYHFFKSFSDSAQCNVYIKAKGKNEHHKIEATFKAFAKALKMAIQQNVNDDSLPSTKGVL